MSNGPSAPSPGALAAPEPPGSREQSPALFLALLMVLALAFRLMPARQVLLPDGVRFYDSDSYYHMRRVWMCLDHFPRVPIRDPFENHPMGGVTMWPPLHDAAIAAVILLIGGSHPSTHLVELVGALAPPVLGALAVLPLYVLGRRLLGRRAGLMAAALMAIQPAHVLYSAVGRPDQHVTEILLSSALYASLAGLSSLDPAARALSARRVWWPRVAASLAATAAVLVWMGSLLFLTVVGAFGALVLLGRVRRTAAPIEPAAHDFAAFFVLQAVLLAASTAYLLHGMEAENTYVSFSWFQAHFSVMAAGLFVIGTACLVGVRSGARAAVRGFAPHLAILALLVAALAPTKLGGTISTTVNALHHINKTTHEVASSDSSHHLLSYNAVWLKSIQEYTPLLYPKGFFDPHWALEYVGPILFLGPLVLAWFLLRRHGAARETRWLVLAWSIASAGMALSQVKYVYLAAPLAAFFLADVLNELLRAGEALRWPASLGAAVAGTIAVLLLWPGFRYLSQFNRGYTDLPETDRAALLALRDLSPDPGGFTDDDAKPAYGVMTFWDLGNYTEYLSRRPVVANNNGYGFDDSVEFFLSKSEDEAVSILERRQARYVLTDDLIADIATMQEALTGSIAPYFRADAARQLTVQPSFFGLVYSRLFFADGNTIDSAAAPPLEHFRLVYEALGMGVGLAGRVVAPTKIFERVAGATLHGSGFQPGAHVTLSTTLRSNLGRTWTDERSSVVGEDGAFTLRTPYGAAETLPVRAQAWALSVAPSGSIALTISEKDVETGATIEVRPLGTSAS